MPQVVERQSGLITPLPGQAAVPPPAPEPASFTTSREKIPNFGSGFTVYAAKTPMKWSDPTSWSTGVLPGSSDIVLIPPTAVVTADVSATIAGYLVHGTLNVLPGVTIQAQNQQVAPDGTLNIGSAANPVPPTAMAELLFPETAPSDTGQWGTGMIVLGTLSIFGTPKTGFIRLAKAPQTGDATLSLSSPVVGWLPNDLLIIPDSRQLGPQTKAPSFVPQWEQVKIASVSTDGLTVALTSPLAFAHPGAIDQKGAVRFLPHVENLTRSVCIRSTKASDLTTRGHVVFSDRANINVQNAMFVGLGRTQNSAISSTNVADRNPVQFRYLNGPITPQANGYQYTFTGNAVWCPVTPMVVAWGINVNASHYGLIQDNVLYNWAGAGLVTKDGSETGNHIEGNCIVRVNGTGAQFDLTGVSGSGFWFRGPNNFVDNNVAASLGLGSGFTYGYYYYVQNIGTNGLGNVTIPAHQGADSMLAGQSTVVNMNAVPLPSCNGNEVYGVSSGGISYWWLGSQGRAQVGSAGTIKNLNVWHVDTYGVYGYETSNLTIDTPTIIGDSSIAYVKTTLYPSSLASVGIWANDYPQHGLTIINPDIEGMRTGIQSPGVQYGVATISGGYLANLQNIVFGTMSSTNGSSWLPAKSTTVNNVKHGRLPGQPITSIAMTYSITGLGDGDFYGNLIQSDQVFVTNHNGVAGDNFQAFYSQQAASFVVPQTTTGLHNLIGSPVAGLTNAQNWAQYQVAIAGAVLPANAQSRSDIVGMIVPTP